MFADIVFIMKSDFPSTLIRHLPSYKELLPLYVKPPFVIGKNTKTTFELFDCYLTAIWLLIDISFRERTLKRLNKSTRSFSTFSVDLALCINLIRFDINVFHAENRQVNDNYIYDRSIVESWHMSHFVKGFRVDHDL